ncbi:universal stress protein [Bosea sp. 2YAB26]|uniref:universal stress protein n=1 Tax=Bosea sp. 2YAB26 TaxID=3237478 RepID=UPI003F92E1A8
MSPARAKPSSISYVSIMALVYPGPDAEGLIGLAASLAHRFSSRLIGIAAEDFVLPYYGDGAVAMDPILVENAKRAAAENLIEAEKVFRRAAGTTSRIEWRSTVCQPRGFILAQSRAADLVVLGRRAPGDVSDSGMAVGPEELIMDLGRPVLLVPPRFEFLSAKRIVVAWKGTREARRAIWDALPLLRQAEAVKVVSVGADAGEQGVEDVCHYLSEHHVSARPVLRQDGLGDPVDQITELARQEGADLIVSGAYGHSRMREWILGGVTNDLLKAAPTCCMMSH